VQIYIFTSCFVWMWNLFPGPEVEHMFKNRMLSRISNSVKDTNRGFGDICIMMSFKIYTLCQKSYD
jgi:hypothetical protein